VYRKWAQRVLDNLEAKGEFDAEVKADKLMARVIGGIRDNSEAVAELKANQAALHAQLALLLQRSDGVSSEGDGFDREE